MSDEVESEISLANQLGLLDREDLIRPSERSNNILVALTKTYP